MKGPVRNHGRAQQAAEFNRPLRWDKGSHFGQNVRLTGTFCRRTAHFRALLLGIKAVFWPETYPESSQVETIEGDGGCE